MSELDPRLLDALSAGARAHQPTATAGRGGLSVAVMPQASVNSDVGYEQLIEGACLAAEQLGALGNPKAVGALVRALSTPSSALREQICDALGALGDLRATSPLLSALRDEDEDVRDAAFEALLRIGQLRSTSMPDASAWESDFADPTAALTQIAWQTDVEAVKLLQAAVRDPDPEVKIGAIYTLCHLGIQASLEDVTQLALQDPSEEVRAAATYGLGELAIRGTPRTVEQVIQTVMTLWRRERSDELRGSILRTISELEHPAGAQLFREALSSPDPVSRQVAVIGLGRLRDPSALSLLAGCLQDASTGVRRNAAHAIGFISARASAQGQARAQLDASVASILVKGAANQKGDIRAAIGASLKRIPRMAALTAIAQSLRGGQEAERASATYLLGHIPDELGLREALRDPSAEVRKRAALASGSAKISSLRVDLEQALSDPEWSVRAGAAEGLKRLADPSSIHLLEATKSKENHPVVKTALEASISALRS